MKISNLRIEDKNDGRSYLTVDIDCSFTDEKTLWFSVEKSNRGMLTDDVYDAFLIAALYPAHYYNESIEIKGAVSPHLARTVKQQLPAVIGDFLREEKRLNNRIFIKETKLADKNEECKVGTGFSGGVDSFCTIADHLVEEDDVDYKLTTLFFFNIGQNGDVKDPSTQKRANGRWEITQKVAQELNLEAIRMDSNMFDIYLPHWEYDAGLLCRISSILVFERCLKRYYISSTYNYGETADFGYSHGHHELANFADLYLPLMLSPENMEICVDGAQYKRSDKVVRIVDYPVVQKYLNVCVNNSPEYIGHNCSVCTKCQRTLLAIESLGKLDKYEGPFSIAKYRSAARQYQIDQRLKYATDSFAKDNIDFAEKHGNQIVTLKDAIRSKRKTKIRHLGGRVLRKLHLIK